MFVGGHDVGHAHRGRLDMFDMTRLLGSQIYPAGYGLRDRNHEILQRDLGRIESSDLRGL